MTVIMTNEGVVVDTEQSVVDTLVTASALEMTRAELETALSVEANGEPVKEAPKENTIVALKNYFSVPHKPCSAREMADFWKVCSDEEKAEFKRADLT